MKKRTNLLHYSNIVVYLYTASVYNEVNISVNSSYIIWNKYISVISYKKKS